MAAALSPKVFDLENPLPPGNSPAFTSLRIDYPLASADWDGWASRQVGTSVFHGGEWARVLADTYGFTPVYIAALCKNQIVAGLPLMEVKSPLTGARGISLPFTDECESLGRSSELTAAIVNECLRIGRGRGWKRVEFRGGRDMFDGAPPSLSFFGHELLLARGESLFNGFDSAVRRAIRKAEKSGLRVEFSESLAAVREFYALHCRTRRRHGLPPQPFRFFERIKDHILAARKGVVVTARAGNRAVASAIFFFNDAEAVYKFGASDEAVLELRANNLVMWQAIQWLATKGVKVLRFGRTSAGNEGLRRFKSSWGTREYVIRYYTFDLSRNAVVPQQDEASGIYNSFFRAAPIFLNRWIGRLLYRHVA